MSLLVEGEWELDGYRFGGGGESRRPVFVLASPLDYGDPALRTQDVDAPGRDGVMVGRDYLGGAEIQMTLGVIDEADVWARLAEVAAVWRAGNRREPGTLSTLRVMRNGRALRAYGRPRKFSVKPTDVNNDEVQQVDVSFTVTDPYWYRETPRQTSNSITLRLVTASSDGGLVLPAVAPLELRPGSQKRTGSVRVDSVVPAPFRVTVKGPTTGALSNIKLAGKGWVIETSASLAWDQTLAIDTRLGTIQRNGVHIPGTLSRASRLNARLQPGAQTISFTGSDLSNTASATLEWLDATPM